MLIKKRFEDLHIFKKDELRPINRREFNRSVHIASIINEVFNRRKHYIELHNFDPEIYLPKGHWARSDDHFVTRNFFEFLNPSYESLNSFRMKTHYFTIGGWKLEYYLDQTRYDSLRPWFDRYVKLVSHIPNEIIAKPPKVLGEIGWDINGYPVNIDLCCYQERLNLMHESNLINWLHRVEKERGVVNILEIGAGYGALANYISKIVPNVNYVICDIPESLLFSAIYLGIVCSDFAHTLFAEDVLDETYCGLETQQNPKYNGSFIQRIAHLGRKGKRAGRFIYVPNYLADNFFKQNELSFDLCINVLSFSEMNEKQVHYYAEVIKKKIGMTGLLFEQNQDNRHIGSIYAKDILDRCFLHRRTIQYETMPDLTMGVADLWGNKDPYAILGCE